MTEDGKPVAPPPVPPLPSNMKTPAAAGAASFKTNSSQGKPPASPHRATESASPHGQKREAARDKIRTGLKTVTIVITFQTSCVSY